MIQILNFRFDPNLTFDPWLTTGQTRLKSNFMWEI